MRLHFARNRFTSFLLMVLMVLLGTSFYCTTAQAQNYQANFKAAQLRVFPKQAYRGSLKVIKSPNLVEIDGKRELLAPGTRVYDVSNRIFPASRLKVKKRYVVNYVRSFNGQVHSIWMLSPREMRVYQPVANPKWWHKLYDNFDTWVDMAKWLGLTSVAL